MTIIDSPGQVAPAEWFTGALMVWHVTSEQSGGAFALGEMWVRPGTEPPLHIHAREDETYYVLEGEVTFSLASTGSRRRRAPTSCCRAASSMGSRCGRRLRGCCTSTRPVGSKKRSGRSVGRHRPASCPRRRAAHRPTTRSRR